jgi:hypothetical protein
MNQIEQTVNKFKYTRPFNKSVTFISNVPLRGQATWKFLLPDNVVETRLGYYTAHRREIARLAAKTLGGYGVGMVYVEVQKEQVNESK